MIRFKLYRNNNSSSTTGGKWYARAVCEETYDTERLAAHISSHSSPFSAGVIHGVLKDMIACIKELVLDGKNVKLDDLAIFSAGLTTLPANSPAEFTPAANIKCVRMRARSTGTFRTAVLTREAKTKQFTEYTVNDDSEETDME